MQIYFHSRLWSYLPRVPILVEGFCGIVYTQQCVKVYSAHRGECVTTGGLYRPTHLCVAHLNCIKKKFHTFFFFWCGKVGECLEGGGWSMFQEVGVCMGFQRGAV